MKKIDRLCHRCAIALLRRRGLWLLGRGESLNSEKMLRLNERLSRHVMAMMR